MIFLVAYKGTAFRSSPTLFVVEKHSVGISRRLIFLIFWPAEFPDAHLFDFLACGISRRAILS